MLWVGSIGHGILSTSGLGSLVMETSSLLLPSSPNVFLLVLFWRFSLARLTARFEGASFVGRWLPQNIESGDRWILQYRCLFVMKKQLCEVTERGEINDEWIMIGGGAYVYMYVVLYVCI